MKFEREVPRSAEAVSPAELKEGSVYFAVQFLDDDLLIPAMEALVFVGRNLGSEDTDQLYFQDAGSYRDGVRYGSASTEDAVFYVQSKNELNHIFEYERAVDVLLRCLLRRRERAAQE
jgi:hypothetical protein